MYRVQHKPIFLGLFIHTLTWSEVMTPLTAAVNFVHSDALQQTQIIRFLQFRHQQFALGNLFRSDVEQFERAVFINHACHDVLRILLNEPKVKRKTRIYSIK